MISKGILPDDHRIVLCVLEGRRPSVLRKQRLFSSLLRNIKIVDFKKDKITLITTEEGVDELIDAYNMTIKDICKQACT